MAREAVPVQSVGEAPGEAEAWKGVCARCKAKPCCDALAGPHLALLCFSASQQVSVAGE